VPATDKELNEDEAPSIPLVWLQFGTRLPYFCHTRILRRKNCQKLQTSGPRRIFVNSMSDMFHEGVPDSYLEEVSRVMVAANWHTYQVLTKRSERVRDLLTGRLRLAAEQANVWWGVSVEDRHFGVPRIGHLQQARSAVSFLSIEPLLESLVGSTSREFPGYGGR